MQSRSSICSEAAEAIANMEDILTEILVLVPARSVVRFKCVSKHWYSLISHPKFCHRHTLQNPNPNISAFFFGNDMDEKSVASVRLGSHGKLSRNPFKALSDLRLKVLQSSNGLFLCVPRYPPIYKYPIHDPFYVINPTTNQFLALSSPMGRVGYFMRYALAFDPSKSSHYKVVCLSDNDHVEIYSSDTRTWRVLKISFASRNCRDLFYRCPGGRYFTMENGVYCNGRIHWMTDPSVMGISYRGGHYDREDHLLYYYDISEDCMNLVGDILTFEREESFPEYYHRYFGESGGHLYLIDMYRNSETQFDVMGMARDYSGWFVRYHVELNLVNTRELGLHNSHMYVLFLGKEEDHQEHEESISSVLLIPRSHALESPNYQKLFDKMRSRNNIFEFSTKGSLVLDKGNYYMETLAPVT